MSSDKSNDVFSWPPSCNHLYEWIVPPSDLKQPNSVWWLEMTDGSSSSGRILLERCINIKYMYMVLAIFLIYLFLFFGNIFF